MMNEILKNGEADVVIINERKRIAVALAYSSLSNKDANAAPKVIAVGNGKSYNGLVDSARRNAVDVVANPIVARVLYVSVPVNSQIPPELYQSVSEILAVVLYNRSRNKRYQEDNNKNSIKAYGRKSMSKHTVKTEDVNPSWKEGHEKEAKMVEQGNDYLNCGDYSAAVKLYKKAAKKGYADAQNKLGIRYFKGEGVSVNYEESFMWHKKAAEQGHKYAEYNIAYDYEMGYGTDMDANKALDWYMRAAKHGEPSAQCRIGNYYWEGKQIEKNVGKAIKYWKKAAFSEEEEAMYNLGSCYFNGTGVKKDMQKAFKLCKRAADIGYVPAMLMTAQCYGTGDGVEADASKMFKWYLSAAKSDSAEGAYYVAEAFEKGIGVKRSESNALSWYKKAAEMAIL